MNENIRQVLILQDRDMKFSRLEEELESLDPERQSAKRDSLKRQQIYEEAKQNLVKLEVRRKDLDNDVETKKTQINKYAQQQLETRKNEEYTALGREIDHAKEAISKIEDEELELLEEIDSYKPKIEEAKGIAEEAKAHEVATLADFDEREKNIEKELEVLEDERASLIEKLDSKLVRHYERLLETKSGKVVVGVDHGNCSGCHMKLQAQTLVDAKSGRDMVTCTNCGRLLYYTREMIMPDELAD
ncbi:MAG: C4-type zinc ribbon domain-containing protein [Verrucomicrobiota bacterium]|jgi:hypothetical protein|nr:C4-type zinc ribbon domain-containing protein [Verrucomicrobiota bacterium]